MFIQTADMSKVVKYLIVTEISTTQIKMALRLEIFLEIENRNTQSDIKFKK